MSLTVDMANVFTRCVLQGLQYWGFARVRRPSVVFCPHNMISTIDPSKTVTSLRKSWRGLFTKSASVDYPRSVVIMVKLIRLYWPCDLVVACQTMTDWNNLDILS